MTKNQKIPATLFALFAILGLSPLAGAATYDWNAGSGTDLLWATPGNWSPSGPPDVTDTALFDNNAVTNAPGAAAADNILAASRTIQVLQYKNTTGYHNTLLQPGVALMVSNSVAQDSLFVGGGIDVVTVSTISGAGGTLVLTNASGNINVRNGGTGFNGQNATLDLSGLDAFYGYMARLLVAADGSSAAGHDMEMGALYLAKTNVIVTVSSTVPALSVGDNAHAGAGGNMDPTLLTSYIYLGAVNSIFADNIGIGRSKGSGAMVFNPVFATPTVYIRGVSSARVSYFSLGDHSTIANSNQRTAGAVDFSGGSVDALLDAAYVGVGNNGNNTGTDGRPSGLGTLTFSQGTIDVNTLNLGYETKLTDTGVGAVGTVNVSGTASLVVNSNLTLSRGSVSQSVPAQGTLNVSGGTVTVNGTITSGGGTSAINYTGGVLNLTNSTSAAGTTSNPISTFSMDNSTINLSRNTGVTPIVVNNLTLNSPTTIQLTALPLITTYPVQLPLIQYASASGDLSTFTLGSLPTLDAIPYQGYLSNNTANMTVDLVVTNGFVPTVVVIWTGTNNADWDFTSFNWTKFGNPTTFFNASLVQFDDSAAGATNINLAGDLIPSTVTVDNAIKSYTFGGTGSLVDFASLIKAGTGTLTFTNSGINTFNGGIQISNGTVQFGNGGVVGNLPDNDQPILDNGTLVLNQIGNVTVVNDITGTGNVIQAGSGVVSMNGSNTYSGQTVVANGSLMVNGSIAGSLLTNAPGTTIGGNGINQGAFNAAGIINPGNVGGGIGTLATGNGLTLYPGAVPTLDLNATDSTAGNGINDLIQVTGDVTANNTTIAINLHGLPQPGMSYTVLTYSGTLHGSFNPVVNAHFAASVDTSTPNQVKVIINGSAAANLRWDSTGSGVWDVGATANWFNIGTSTADIFGAGDSVLFDDSVAGVQTNIAIAQGVAVYPTAFTNNSSANNYTISGGGTIGGPTALIKDGTSTLTINTTNSFSGGTTILNGTVVTGTSTALGENDTSAIVNTIANGATLDINGQSLGAATFVVSGGGVGGLGAIINSGTSQNYGIANLILAGDTTLGGLGQFRYGGGNTPGRWDIYSDTGATLTCAGGNPYNLTKVGNNQVTLVGVAVDPNLANITVQAGALGIQAGISSLGNPTNTLTLYSNTLLHCAGFDNTLSKLISMTNAAMDCTGNGANTFDQPVTLQGSNTITVTHSLTFSGAMGGSGGFAKFGNDILTLNASNSYTGSTFINAGYMYLNGPATISSSTNIVLGANCTLYVYFRDDGTMTILSGHTFNGSGILYGSLANNPGSTLIVGGSGSIGTLQVVLDATLQGTTYMEVSNNGAQFDVLQAGSSIVYGGTLVVSNLDGLHPFAAGQAFQFFNGPVSGAFDNIVPAHPRAGLDWDTSTLASDGTLRIIAGEINTDPATADFQGVVTGNSLQFTWAPDHLGWRLEVQTNNLNIGLSTNWYPVPDSTSSDQMSIPIDPSQPAVFYRLAYPSIKELRREAANRQRRMIFNNDGNDAIRADPTAQSLLDQRTTGLEGTFVDSIFYNVRCTGFSLMTYFTKIGTVFTNTEPPYARNKMLGFFEAGIDPLQVMVDFGKQHNIEVFCSFRMNDTHDAADDQVAFHANPLKVAHPEYLIGTSNNPPKYGGWTAVDYGRPEIRELAFRYAEEVCNNYDVDGIELDFFRHPVFLKSTGAGLEATDSERTNITAMIQRIRTMADDVGRARGKPILIAVRVPDSVPYSRAIGLEWDTWMANDLIDLLVVSGYFKLNDWDYSVALAHQYGVKVYPSLDDSRLVDPDALALRETDLAYRGRAANVWGFGADGVYMFNVFDPQSPLWRQLGDPHVLSGLDEDYFGTVRGRENAAGGNLPYSSYQTVEILNPRNTKTIARGSTVTSRINVGEDLSQAGPVNLKFRLQFSTAVDPSFLAVTCNDQPVTFSGTDSLWVEYTASPAVVQQVTNVVKVKLLSGAPQSSVVWRDLMLQVRH